MAPQRQIHLKDLNPHITCSLCGGYLIDATSLVVCRHVFCRACILRHFEARMTCPTCNFVYKRKPKHPCFWPDTVMQSLVYKLVPGLYAKEVQRREDFYRGSGVRPGSSCSEDSALGDLNEEHDEWLQSTLNDENVYLCAEDVVSLSLEYYQSHLDQHQPKEARKRARARHHVNNHDRCESDLSAADRSEPDEAREIVISDRERTVGCGGVETRMDDHAGGGEGDDGAGKTMTLKRCNEASAVMMDAVPERRYLQCPAAVTMSHLQKFLRMKYAVSLAHRVDLIYAGEVLPTHFSLIDVAYTFKWTRTKPLRFFYRIFTPVKIQPIKIINTSSSIGEKQLQVVPAKFPTTPTTPTTPVPDPKSPPPPPTLTPTDPKQLQKDKEHLMANLQLQSKPQSPCVYEYEEPDHEEIREFAEKRDREWALQKQLDEEKERKSRKRKRKEKKNGPAYKKRKFHAEITSSDSVQREEGLKLKVKLTPHNGYKHRHHKSASPTQKTAPSVVATADAEQQLSAKEKLLQMRQVRHKHSHHHKDDVKSDVAVHNNNNNKVVPPPPLVMASGPRPVAPTDSYTPKTLRSDFTIKTKEVGRAPAAAANTTAAASTDIKEKQSFLKTGRPYAEKRLNGTLDQKLANLYAGQQQQNNNKAKKTVLVPYSSPFTVSKVEVGGKKREQGGGTPEKRPSLEITLIPTPQQQQNNRTMAAATAAVGKTASAPIGKAATATTAAPPTPKRPPPPTIPLERIRKSYTTLKHSAAISILPAGRATTDSNNKPAPSGGDGGKSAPLDLTKAHEFNGLATKTSPPPLAIDRNLVNLQMLSKVALDEIGATANKVQMAPPHKKPPPLTSLSMLKTAGGGTQKTLPKLNEIGKGFRLSASTGATNGATNGATTHMRNMRPHQNQSVRSIPNPSLLAVRQQSQHRLGSVGTTTTSATATAQTTTTTMAAPVVAVVTTSAGSGPTTTTLTPSVTVAANDVDSKKETKVSVDVVKKSGGTEVDVAKSTDAKK